MRRISKMFTSIFVSCLTIIGFTVANSSSCYYIHQPNEPKEIYKFKMFK